jgi:hypothetical protein
MATRTSKRTAEYRGFKLIITRNRNSGHWSGLAKGISVLISGNFEYADGAIDDLRSRVDDCLGRGERLFRTYCVERDDRWAGQFAERHHAALAEAWARDRIGRRGQIRPLRNFLPTLGRVVYQLTV